MSGARPQRKPTFRRQAALILLPVLVLAAVGWMSLRQDKILAEHDARERARVIANDLVPEILSLLTSDSPGQPEFSFYVNDAGQLTFPPPFDPVPTPRPFDLESLGAQRSQLWLKLQGANLRTVDPEPLVAVARELIDSNPPEPFAAAAYYDLGLLYQRQGRLPEAAEAFGLVAKQYGDVSSESGLPFQVLAQFQLGRMWMSYTYSTSPHSGAELDTFCSNAVYRPTVLTPYFLAWIHAGHIEKWEAIWDRHETSRELFAAARPYLTDLHLSRLPPEAIRSGRTNDYLSGSVSNRPLAARLFFWVETQELVSHRRVKLSPTVQGLPPLTLLEQRWLVIRADHNATNQEFRCLSQSDVGDRVGTFVTRTRRIPDYFGVSVEVAGTRLSGPGLDLGIWHYNQLVGSKGPGGMAKYGTGEVASTPLATAESDGNPAVLKVGVYLTSPTTLYQRQRIRAGWFGLVILVSIASALIGLAAAWRAFNRQQQLNEMKSNFVSSVSHELRAPIASVRLMAESLDRGKIHESQKQAEYYRFIVEECRRLTSLIENVLDFSRIEQGRKQYELEPTNLAALTRETVRLMEPYAAERGVGLEFETFNVQHSTFNAELEADGRAIQQALVNLIDNAIKHSPKGETVKIGLEQVSGIRYQASGSGSGATLPSPDTSHLTPDTPSSFLCLYVEDNGPGIPPDEHEKIFERFYRRGSELRRETQGVGIGLSIVKHVVEAHGGRVVVRSAVGQGSRFTIELPVKK